MGLILSTSKQMAGTNTKELYHFARGEPEIKPNLTVKLLSIAYTGSKV